MFKFYKKLIEWDECEAYFDLKLENYSYNNNIYSFDFTIRCVNTNILHDEDSWPEEYNNILKELFGITTYIYPLFIANINFSVHENDIIISNDTIYFNMNELKNYNCETIDVRLYKCNSNEVEISNIIASEDITSLLMNHSKGKEMIDHLKNTEIFYNSKPGYGEDTFPNSYSTNGLEYIEE